MTVDAGAAGWAGGRYVAELAWPPAPDDPSLLAELVERMRGVDELDLTEQVSSGPGTGGADSVARLDGERFLELVPYGAGDAVDVRPVASEADAFAFVLPGSGMHITVWRDQQGRVARQRIVSPGHEIHHRITYPDDEPAGTSEPRAAAALAANQGAASPALPEAGDLTLGAGAGWVLRYPERLAEAGIESSVGSVGDSFDTALAETVIGLFKTEVIRRHGPWRSIDDVEFAVLEWVDWFNHGRLLEPIGMIPPAEHEAAYNRQTAPADAPSVSPDNSGVPRISWSRVVGCSCCSGQGAQHGKTRVSA